MSFQLKFVLSEWHSIIVQQPIMVNSIWFLPIFEDVELEIKNQWKAWDLIVACVSAYKSAYTYLHERIAKLLFQKILLCETPSPKSPLREIVRWNLSGKSLTFKGKVLCWISFTICSQGFQIWHQNWWGLSNFVLSLVEIV